MIADGGQHRFVSAMKIAPTSRENLVLLKAKLETRIADIQKLLAEAKKGVFEIETNYAVQMSHLQIMKNNQVPHPPCPES